jgi:histidinol-phosphate aminotransferase
MYPILARSVGATPIEVPETDRRVDVDAILAAVTPRTRLVFIANPANPTGTLLPEAEVWRLAEGLPGDTILVHDGAYAEYVPGFDGGAALVAAFPNVVMTRTFSKIHGLGGARIGWGYAQRGVIDVLGRLRQPFNLSAPQLAAAEAAILDTAWRDRCRDENARGRRMLTDALRQMGLGVDDSFTNFVLARFTDAAAANAADAALRAEGILVRRVAGYHLPQALRITVGTEADTTRVIAALGTHLRGAR